MVYLFASQEQNEVEKEPQSQGGDAGHASEFKQRLLLLTT
jgi:hypothetical protein